MTHDPMMDLIDEARQLVDEEERVWREHFSEASLMAGRRLLEAIARADRSLAKSRAHLAAAEQIRQMLTEVRRRLESVLAEWATRRPLAAGEHRDRSDGNRQGLAHGDAARPSG